MRLFYVILARKLRFSLLGVKYLFLNKGTVLCESIVSTSPQHIYFLPTMTSTIKLNIQNKQGTTFGPYHWKHILEWHEFDIVSNFTWNDVNGERHPVSELADKIGVPATICTNAILHAPMLHGKGADSESMRKLKVLGFPSINGSVNDDLGAHLVKRMLMSDDALNAEDSDFDTSGLVSIAALLPPISTSVPTPQAMLEKPEYSKTEAPTENSTIGSQPPVNEIAQKAASDPSINPFLEGDEVADDEALDEQFSPVKKKSGSAKMVFFIVALLAIAGGAAYFVTQQQGGDDSEESSAVVSNEALPSTSQAPVKTAVEETTETIETTIKEATGRVEATVTEVTDTIKKEVQAVSEKTTELLSKNATDLVDKLPKSTAPVLDGSAAQEAIKTDLGAAMTNALSESQVMPESEADAALDDAVQSPLTATTAENDAADTIEGTAEQNTDVLEVSEVSLDQTTADLPKKVDLDAAITNALSESQTQTGSTDGSASAPLSSSSDIEGATNSVTEAPEQTADAEEESAASAPATHSPAKSPVNIENASQAQSTSAAEKSQVSESQELAETPTSQPAPDPTPAPKSSITIDATGQKVTVKKPEEVTKQSSKLNTVIDEKFPDYVPSF